MEPSFLIAIVALVVAVTVGLRIAAGMFDGERIREYLLDRNCKMIRHRWQPFARGWLVENQSRTYSVEYEDPRGWRRRATVRTSMWTGVFFTEDTLIEDVPSEVDRLRAENARLRSELDQRS